VSCGDGNPERGGDSDDDSGAGFCGEPVDGLQSDHFVTESLNDAPATGSGTGGHDDSAEQFDPGGDLKFFGVFGQCGAEEAEPFGEIIKFSAGGSGGECEGDDAHGFLGIVGAVHESHGTGTEQLCASEDESDGAWAPVLQQEVQQSHDGKSQQEAAQGR